MTRPKWFQSTPPHGGRLLLEAFHGVFEQVSIHAPAWGATQRHWTMRHRQCFNPRPRMGGDRRFPVSGRTLKCFNPRPRMGGDPRSALPQCPQCKFQSTPPHGGRHANCAIRSGWQKVSIHAPAWGATQARRALPASVASFNPRPRMGGDLTETNPALKPAESFNPRPRMGGDRRMPCQGTRRIRFQSTPPHGGRPTAGCFLTPWGPVSIHAPAWGATKFGGIKTTNPEFQSTPPHGGRRGSIGFVLLVTVFQSTPPHGGRHMELGVHGRPKAFQSTPPHGGRLEPPEMGTGQSIVSIHAPAWGATAVSTSCSKQVR